MGTRERDVPRRRTLYDVLEGRTDEERYFGRESPAVRRTDLEPVPDRYVWNRPDDPPPPRTPDRQLTMDESLRTGQGLERSVYSSLMSTGPARQRKKAEYEARQARIKEDRKTKEARIQRTRAVADSAMNLARSYGGGVVGSGPGEAAAAAGEAAQRGDDLIAGPLLDTAIGGFGKGVGHMISAAGRASGSEAIQRYGEEVKYVSEVAQSPDQMIGMDELKEFGDYVKFAVQQTSSGAGSMGPVIGGAAIGATIGSIAGPGGALIGGVAGGLMAGFPLIYGETVDALESEGITGPGADIAAVLGGLAGSALELIVPLKFARRLAPGTDVAIKRALKQAIIHIAKVGGVDALQEGTTELLQTQIPAAATLLLTEGEVNKFTTKEHWLETGIATGIGMLLGGSMGTVGGVAQASAENLQAEAMDNLTGLLNDTRLEDDQLTPDQVNGGYPMLAQYQESRRKQGQPDLTIEEINRFYDTLALVQGDADAGGLAQDAVEELAEVEAAAEEPVEPEVAPAPSETAEMDVLPDQELGRTFDVGEEEEVEPVEQGEYATQELADLAAKAKETTKASRAAKVEAKAEKAEATDKAREEAERLGVTIEQVRQFHADRLGDDWKEHRVGYYEVRWAADRIQREARPQEEKDAEERAWERSRTQTAGAMALIDEHGLTDAEVATIKPSSKDGKRITHNDVKGYLKTRTAAPAEPALEVEPAAEPAAVEDYEIRPLTTKKGKQFYEVFGPDGKRIAKVSTEQAAQEQIDVHRGQPAVSKPEVEIPETAASRAGMPPAPQPTEEALRELGEDRIPGWEGAIEEISGRINEMIESVPLIKKLKEGSKKQKQAMAAFRDAERTTLEQLEELARSYGEEAVIELEKALPDYDVETHFGADVEAAIDLAEKQAAEPASTETVVPGAVVKREALPAKIEDKEIQEIPEARRGKDTQIIMSDGSREEAFYAWLPIDSVIGSHTTAYSPEQGYPEGVQNRDYATDKAAQQTVEQGVTQFDADRVLDTTQTPLEGPPIINLARETLSGTNRLLILKKLKEAGKSGPYEDRLIQRQGELQPGGAIIDAEGMGLFRVLKDPKFVTDRAAMRRLAVDANIDLKKDLAPWDDAATRMDAFETDGQAAMQILTEGIAADQTLINFLESEAGWRFFEALIKAGVFKSSEMATYADPDDTKLTQQGRNVIEKLVFAAAVGDVTVAKALDADGVRQVANKVKAAAPAILKAATIEEFDRRPTIRDALDILIRINENPNITNIMDLFGQGGLWAADQTVLEGFPPDAKRVAVWLQTTTQNVVKAKLRDFGLVSESQGAGGTQQELGATLMTVAEIDRLFEELTSIDDMGPEVFREAGLPYTGAGALARSRATDLLGRLKTFYHGTRTAFSTFDQRFARVENLYGPGFYFTDTPNVASGGYSGNELGVYQIGRGMWDVQPDQRQLYQLVNSHPLVQLYKNKSAKTKNLKTGSAEYYVWNHLTEVRELESPWHELFSVVNIVDPNQNTELRQELTDAAVKLGYMKLTGAPNVHFAKLAVKNPFEIDKVWTREEVLALYDKIYALSEATAISGEKIELTEAFHTNLHVALMAELMETGPYRPMMGSHPGGMEIGADEAHGDAVYQTIRRVAGDLRFGERSEFYPDENQWQPAARLNPLLVVNGILDTIGYDAVEHDGGIRGGVQPHQVYAVFRPESILPAWYEAAPEVDTEATRVYSSESGWETVGEIESAYGSTEAQEEATKALLGTAGRFATAVFADGTEINALEAVGIPSFKTRLQWVKRGFFGRPKGAYVDVGGQVLTTPDDFIRFLQPFRDPRFELLGGIITDSQGRVVWVEYYSSGSVRMVVLDKLHRRIARKLNKLYSQNPDENYTFHLSHNHPSGDPSPSTQDVDATNIVTQYVTKHGPPNAKFGSHWVIDHDSVAEMVNQQVLTHPVPTDIQSQPDWTDAIGPKLDSKLVYDTMRPATGRAVAIITDQQHQVLAVEPHSNESVKKIANWMDQTLRRYGGNGIVLVTSDEETYKHIINNSELAGGLTEGHESIAPELVPNMVSGGLMDVLFIAENIPDIFPPTDLGNYFKGANAAGLLTMRSTWYGERPGEKGDYTVRVHEQQNPYGEDVLQAALGNPNDFRSPDVRERWDESKGLPHDPLAVRVNKALKRMYDSFTRHFPLLNPKIATHAAVADKLRIWEASPEYAVKMAADAVAYVVQSLSTDKAVAKVQVDLVTRIIALPDILKDIESGLYDGRAKKVPFYGVLADGSQAELDMIVREIEFDLARFEQQAAQDPAVTQALNRRSEVTTRLARALVKAELLNEDVLVDPRYYHRQVIAAFSDKGHASLGKMMDEVRTTRRGFQKARHGGGDFNTRYVESEFEWMQQGFHQLATKEAVEAVRDIADVRPQAERLAAAANEAAMVTEMEDADWDEGFRVAIARANGKLAKMAVDGELYGGPFQHIVDQLAQAKEEYESIIAGMDRGEKGAFRKSNPFRFNHEQWFPFLAWLVNTGGPGSAQAGSIFKTIHERKALMRETLGRRFRTWRHFKPEGYTVWQPREGNLLYPAVTIGERHLEAALERLSQAGGMSAEEAQTLKEELESRTQKQLVLGGRLPEWVIPEEIAQTLNSIRNVEHGYLGRMHLRLLRAWKVWTLLNPTRWLKYNTNNQTGDIDGILAWNAGPLAPKRVKGAWKGLRTWGKGTADKKTKAHYDKMLKLGVIGSNFAAQEIPDINDFQAVRHLLSDDPNLFQKVVNAYWHGFSKGATNFRENLLRVTAYEFILEQMKAGKTIYGASNRHVVDAIKDVDERAARVARDLVGDYGNRTEAGQWIRERLMPFWSWAEINFGRYIRLFQNAGYDELTSKGGIAKAGTRRAATAAAMTTAAMFVRINLLYLIIFTWNQLVAKQAWDVSEEEYDRFFRQRRQLHLIVGRHSDGSLATIRTEGAWSDWLEWWNAHDWIQDAQDVARTDKTVLDVVAEAVKAPVERVANSLEPFGKTALEAAFQRSTFPSLFEEGTSFRFRPRVIRDPKEHIAQMWSFERLYRRVTGRPHPPGGALSVVGSILLYRTDPGEAMYWESRGMAFDWLEDQGRDSGSYTPTKKQNALYYYRKAIVWGDEKAQARWLERYRDEGGTERGMNQSLRMQHPLGMIAKRDQQEFLDTLTDQERDAVERAEEWYELVYGVHRTDTNRGKNTRATPKTGNKPRRSATSP